jgi:SAM-dependent methyltransferase
MSWIDYWNAAPTIYVSERHKRVHCTTIADALIARLDGADAVLDYGCGEALMSERVAAKCGRLYLYDAAPSVQDALKRRHAGHLSIVVLSDDDLSGWEHSAIDLVVANSVIQYLDQSVLTSAIETWKRIMRPDGRILIADVIPRSVGPLVDAIALLRFAGSNGFFLAAITGLVRTYFSDYKKFRKNLGLTRFEEAEFVAFMRENGLEALRIRPNVGHNQARMTFVATLR